MWNCCGSRCRLMNKRQCVWSEAEIVWDWVGKRKFCQSWRSRSSDGRTRWRWPSEKQRQTCGNWSNRSDVNRWNYKRPHTNSFKRSLRQTVCLHRTELKRESSRSTPTYRRISVSPIRLCLLATQRAQDIGGGGGAFHSQLFIHGLFEIHIWRCFVAKTECTRGCLLLKKKKFSTFLPSRHLSQ